MNGLANTPSVNALALLAGRLLLAAIFVISGYNKIGGFAGTQAYMAKAGVPGALLPAVIALELIGGIAIVLGFQTRLVALLLSGFTLLAGLLFHFDWSQAGQQVHFLKNLAMAGGFLMLFVAGPGAYSVDAKRS